MNFLKPLVFFGSNLRLLNGSGVDEVVVVDLVGDLDLDRYPRRAVVDVVVVVGLEVVVVDLVASLYLDLIGFSVLVTRGFSVLGFSFNFKIGFLVTIILCLSVTKDSVTEVTTLVSVEVDSTCFGSLVVFLVWK